MSLHFWPAVWQIQRMIRRLFARLFPPSTPYPTTDREWFHQLMSDHLTDKSNPEVQALEIEGWSPTITPERLRAINRRLQDLQIDTLAEDWS